MKIAGMCLWMRLHLTSCLSYCRLVHICRILRRAQKRVADKIVTSSGEETFFEPNIDIDTLYWAQKYWALGSNLVILFACHVCKGVNL